LPPILFDERIEGGEIDYFGSEKDASAALPDQKADR
jgi:hypothetical protein